MRFHWLRNSTRSREGGVYKVLQLLLARLRATDLHRGLSARAFTMA
jgi:hypothetical protein